MIEALAADEDEVGLPDGELELEERDASCAVDAAVRVSASAAAVLVIPFCAVGVLLTRSCFTTDDPAFIFADSRYEFGESTSARSKICCREIRAGEVDWKRGYRMDSAKDEFACVGLGMTARANATTQTRHGKAGAARRRRRERG